MGFKRAVTKRQRDIRRDKIGEEALRLFMYGGIDSVTFNNISKNIGYNRSILYNLYETPADILLECLSKKIAVIYSKLEIVDEDVPAIYRLTGLLDLDYELKALAAVFGSAIEPDASIKYIMQFRETLRNGRKSHCALITDSEPNINCQEFECYMDSMYLLYVGTANYNPAGKRVKMVNKMIKFDMPYISFSEFWLRIYGKQFTNSNGHKYLLEIDKQVKVSYLDRE